MRSPAPRPPAVWRRLLEWAAARLGTPDLAGDAADLFVERARRQGEGPARRWYRRQALAALRRLPFSRRRGGRGRARSARRARAGGGPPASLLDFKLGLRMLLKYPGLTAVSGVAMAFAIAVGAGAFEFARDAMYPELAVPDGERLVRLQRVDRRLGARVGVPPEELRAWRDALRTVEEVGAFQGFARNLWLGGEEVVAAEGLAVSPSAFGIAGARPHLGRALVEADAAAGAAPVIVLGHDLWRSRFGSDAGVIGRVVRLGDQPATVVGVLPERFGFPAPAELYAPLRLDDLARRSAAGERVSPVVGFGRLAGGATVEDARSELAIVAAEGVGQAASGREHVVAELRPFAYPLITTSGILTNLVFALTAFFLVMLIVVVCANVALLLFARAATREAEMAVRFALGASRGRIVAQLFIEALVLAGVAALAGLIAAAAGLKRAMHVLRANPTDATPFWIGDTLSAGTIVWAILLALFGAAIAGVIPGLKVTGRAVSADLQRRAGRGSITRLGGVWTAIVVAQVALTVIFIPVVLAIGSAYWKVRTADRGIAAEHYLVARVERDGDPAGLHEAVRRLRAGLASEAWVRGASAPTSVWPGYGGRGLEVEGLPAPADPSDLVRTQHMDVDGAFFDVMDARLLVGRTLDAEDVDDGRPVVVVDDSFVREVLGGRNALGRRIRVAATATDDGEDPPWHEIVGVVADLRLNPFAELPSQAVVYWPLVPDRADGRAVIVRVAGEPAAFANRLRVLALEADAGMRLEQPVPLDYRMDRPAAEYGAWFRVLATGGALALLLTLAGVYAVVAFTVSRRTREIGVRVALGADRRQVVRAVLARAASHIGYGVLAGGTVIPLLMLAVSRALEEEGRSIWPPLHVSAAILTLYLAVMLAACLLACVVPVRRALAVHPMEALADEA